MAKEKKKTTTFFGKPIKYPELDPSIRDREDDWLTQQLKEEAEAYKRVCEMFGISPHVSDATVLRVEHAIEHEIDRNTQAYRR